MFCYKCGAAIQDESAYCDKCGAPMADGPASVQPKVPAATAVMPLIRQSVPNDVASSPQEKGKGLYVALGALAALVIVLLVLLLGRSCSSEDPAASEQSSKPKTAAVEEQDVEEDASANKDAEEEAQSEKQQAEPEGKKDATSMPSIVFDDSRPFWGAWVFASRSESEAWDYAVDMTSKGFESHVVLSTDWENLNDESWYCVTVGSWKSEADANEMVGVLKDAGYSDAYAKQTGERYGSSAAQAQEISSGAFNDGSPFWGAWVSASQSESEARKFAADLTGKGYPSFVVLSSEWGNLNSDPWYCVTVGVWNSEAEAREMAHTMQGAGFYDAYAKYSGDYLR